MTWERSILNTIAKAIPNAGFLNDDAFYDEMTRQIYTTDMLVEDQHFSWRYFTPADLGWRAAAVNVSDIAAMGGKPLYLLVSLGLPKIPEPSLEMVFDLYRGIQSLCEAYGLRIIGGDTVGALETIINIAVVGELPSDHTLGCRNNAMPGDVILLTGFPGLSNVGLQALQKGIPDFTVSKQAHLRPTPKIWEGLLLSKGCSRYSLMDTSDGLADALLKIAETSRVRMEIFADQLPIHEELLQYSAGQGIWEAALYGGEDFDLLATVPEVSLNNEILASFKPIGRVITGEPGAVLLGDSGEVMETLSLAKTFQHFES